MQEDKQIFTTNSFSKEVIKKIKSLYKEIRETLKIEVSKSKKTEKLSTPPVVKNEVKNIPEEKAEKQKPTKPEIQTYKADTIKPEPETSSKTKSRKKISKLTKPEKDDTEKYSEEAKEKMMLVFIGVAIIGIIIFAIIASAKHLKFFSAEKQITENSQKGKFCGGIVNIKCPEGYKCKLEGNYPDAGGTCVKVGFFDGI